MIKENDQNSLSVTRVVDVVVVMIIINSSSRSNSSNKVPSTRKAQYIVQESTEKTKGKDKEREKPRYMSSATPEKVLLPLKDCLLLCYPALQLISASQVLFKASLPSNVRQVM